MQTKILRQRDIKQILSVVGRDAIMDRLIDDLHNGFAALGRGELAEAPPRSGFARGGEVPGVIEFMPYRVPGVAVTMKTISYSPHNYRRFRLPTVVGTVSRLDDDSGSLIAFADAAVITAMRTGAVSAIASRLLARPDSATLALIGAGAQAVTQAHALSRVLPIERILVSDTDPDHAESFAGRVAFLGLTVDVTGPAAAVAAADVLSTVTSVPAGEGPVLPAGPRLPHLHVNATGADEPGKTELPRPLLDDAFICVDHPGQARAEGEFQQLPDRDLGPSLASLCAAPSSATAHVDSLSVLDSTGSAFADHIAFDVLLGFADELGLGRKAAIGAAPEDVLDPYSLPW
ncbi:ornithine cyclodeaminase family protein [Streptomyces kanamyceticus]|uniref:Lysine cyclodeaminase n=1 Tax=Streptomyces kanamyceticus TaxID=1967 RepID=E9KTB3_STRKN|nr:ornithine cyclodeaminase family protein [Streptomyces kanamyceticus]ADU56245.1 lysine cyclodeaminase [Streptomyces kanamyceticus]QEU89898.1 ornithine cyclodeaminase family protein [Streptomyces kanamyceticus]